VQQDLDLLLHNAKEDIILDMLRNGNDRNFPQLSALLLGFDVQRLIRRRLLVIRRLGRCASRAHNIPSCLGRLLNTLTATRDGQQRHHYQLFHVGVAEAFRDVGNDGADIFWELEVVIRRQLRPPVFAVRDAALARRDAEVVLAVEARWPLRNGRVEAAEVVGGADHEDAVVGLQPVDLVQEVRAHLLDDQAVEIFEDQQARRHLARLVEDRAHTVLRHVALVVKALDIQRRDWLWEVGEVVHQSLDRDRLPVTRHTMEDDTALPRHFVLAIEVLVLEEALHIFDQALLHLGIHDYIIPGRVLNAFPELARLHPLGIIEDVYLLMDFRAPFADFMKELVSERVVSLAYRSAALQSQDEPASIVMAEARVLPRHSEQEEVVFLPSEGVAAELDGIYELAWFFVQPTVRSFVSSHRLVYIGTVVREIRMDLGLAGTSIALEVEVDCCTSDMMVRETLTKSL